MISLLDEAKIEEIERRTDPALRKIQETRGICKFDLQVDGVSKYVYKGESYKVTNGAIYAVKNLPMHVKSTYELTYLMTLKQAIMKNYVQPLLLIKEIDGINHVISANDVIVVRDYTYTYIIIDKVTTDIKLHCYTIGCPITQFTNDLTYNLSFGKGFMFDADGFYTSDYTKATYSFLLKNYGEYTTTTISFSGENYISTRFNSQPVFMNNMVLFYNKMLVTDPSDYLIDMGNNTFKPKSGISSSKLKCALCYYDSGKTTANHYRHLEYSGRSSISNMVIKGNTPSYYDELNTPLDLSTDTVGHDNILQDKYNKIFAYDSNLLRQDIVKTPEPDKLMSSKVYTGSAIKSKLDSNNKLSISRKVWTDSYKPGRAGLNNILVFYNNTLFAEYSNLEYTCNCFVLCDFSGITIASKDRIEIVYISGAEDISTTITIPQANSTITTSYHYRLDNCEMYLKDPSAYSDYGFNNNDTMQYSVDFTATPVTGEEYTYTVSLADESLYGTSLILVPKQRFASYSFTQTNYEDIRIRLPKSFKYCQDISRYFLFINGVKYPNKFLKLVIPKKENAFYELAMYTQKPIPAGAKVTVMYLPFSDMQEITNTITENTTDMTFKVNGDLPYALNTYNYLFFINGRKLSPNDIKIISSSIVSTKYTIKYNNSISIVYIGKSSDQTDDYTDNDAWSELAEEIPIAYTDTNYKFLIEETDVDILSDIYSEDALPIQMYRDYYSEYNSGYFSNYEGDSSLLTNPTGRVDSFLLEFANSNINNKIF